MKTYHSTELLVLFILNLLFPAIPITWAGSTKILRLSKIHLLLTSSHILFFVKSCKLYYKLTTFPASTSTMFA